MTKRFKNLGVDLADKVANFVGSWKFIIWQSVILIIWMVVNIKHVVDFDPYPFILMNLLLSSQAAYATPMILMSGNRQAEKDRKQLQRDIDLDNDTNIVINEMSKALKKLNEDLELDRQAIREHAALKEEIKKLSKKIDKLQKQ